MGAGRSPNPDLYRDHGIGLTGDKSLGQRGYHPPLPAPAQPGTLAQDSKALTWLFLVGWTYCALTTVSFFPEL